MRNFLTVLNLNKLLRYLMPALLLGIGPVTVWANSASQSKKAETTTRAGEPSPKTGDTTGDDQPEPFLPHWTGDIGFNFSTQPSQSGQGQVTADFALTGTYNFTSGGHFLSLGASGGQQTVEGANTNYGSFTAGAGLGFGFFLPSLDFVFQQGASALNSIASTLTLNFQIFDPLSLGGTLGGGFESHQGPKSQIPIKGWSALDKIVEIDSANWTAGLTASFRAWDFLSFSLTGQDETSSTYQIQTVLHTTQTELTESEQILSGTLGLNFTFFEDLTLGFSLQEGQELYPAGTIYSQVLKQTVNFSKPTSVNFSGYTFEIGYSLP